MASSSLNSTLSLSLSLSLFNHSQQQEGRIVDSIDVICPSDRKVGGGRGSRQNPVPVKRFALDHGLDVFHTPPQLYVDVLESFIQITSYLVIYFHECVFLLK